MEKSDPSSSITNHSSSNLIASSGNNIAVSNNSQSMIFHWMNPTSRRIVLYILNVPTAADSLPLFWFYLATSGKQGFLFLLAIWVVFCMLWFPFYLLTYLLTEFGVYALLAGTIAYTGRLVIRLLAFPGASSRVSGEIEREFAKYSVRLLNSAINSVMELASAIIILEPSTGATLSLPAKYNEIASAWKRVQSYRNRVLGLFYSIFIYIYEEGDSPDVYPNSSCNVSQLNSFGNNKLSGDIGNLSGITIEAKLNGRRLLTMLAKLLADITTLEQQAALLLNNSGRFVPQDACNDNVKASAQRMMQSSTELKNFLPTLAPDIKSDEDEEEDEDIDDPNLESLRRTIGNKPTKSVWETISNVTGFILPLLDPGEHNSIFGLDILRGAVLSRYKGASQFWIRRPNGGMIDAFHIPALGWQAENGRNPKAVLYCNPNAGLIEVATGMSLGAGNCSQALENLDENCWTDFYTSKGYDIYLFNYAGYGRSHGTSKSVTRTRSPGFLAACWRIIYNSFFAFSPTPDTLRLDAFVMGSYLINELGIDQLIIHGESIGGVGASGAAKRLTSSPNTIGKVSLLICDRTFANLQAIAQRLVGTWTAPAITMLAPFWNTDVVADYLSAKCAKVIAQDCADIIIADPGSLKSGVAFWKEIRNQTSSKGVGLAVAVPFEYRAAEWENVGVRESRLAPSIAAFILPPKWPMDSQMSQAVGFHFAACARRIGTLSTQERKGIRAGSESSDIEEGLEMGIDRDSLLSDSVGTFSGISNAWAALSSCDGLCGGPLGIAVKKGYDWTLSWLCSALVFGGQVVVRAAEKRCVASNEIQISSLDFDCRQSGQFESSNSILNMRSIPEVISSLKKILETSDSSIRAAEYEISFCIGVLEYIVARLSDPASISSSKQSKEMRDPLGHFLTLRCGHNSQFSIEERLNLTKILNEIDTIRRVN